MTDPYSGGRFEDPQSAQIGRSLQSRAQTAKSNTFSTIKDDKQVENANKEESKSAAKAVSVLYKDGKELIEKSGNYVIELSDSGDHIHHRILAPQKPSVVEGITYPGDFTPLQDLFTEKDLGTIESLFSGTEKELRDFWTPLFKPKRTDTDLSNFSERLIKMKKIEKKLKIHEPLIYGHCFDPNGKLTNHPHQNQPRIWVPAKEWFSPNLHNVKMADVFTIFPEAELELLTLLIGRIGVGRSNHIPPGFTDPIDHTARMAAVIIGKDPGLGKSTIFNGMTAAFSKCGFVTETFRSLEDRFGLGVPALADIAYKDDTAMKSLKSFLASEETKIMVTNGMLQVEDKHEKADKIWSRCVLIVNSNDWDPKFTYDLDPGIVDRVKLISTYREQEIKDRRRFLAGTVSEGTPDLRPRAHLPFLAKKLGVSVDALFLWCLRLATDRFWEVISDNSDPTVNQLQNVVRYWTTRQRIRFKSDTTQALVNSMAISAAIRQGDDYFMPELTPEVLARHLRDLLFIGTDKSATYLMDRMKAKWEEAGRIPTHYYQGFREIRWETVQLAIDTHTTLFNSSVKKSPGEMVKDIMGRLGMRDGFQISTGIAYVIGDWNNTRYGLGEILEEAKALRSTLSEAQLKRICDKGTSPTVDWLSNPEYSPDRAEEFRPVME